MEQFLFVCHYTAQTLIRMTADIMKHPDEEVNHAIVQLNDALCTWERNTGRQSVLIIREEGGWQHRSMSGKPGIPDHETDEQLMHTVGRNDYTFFLLIAYVALIAICVAF